MTDDQAWQMWYSAEMARAELVRRNVEATNALFKLLKKPKFRHHLNAMAKMRE